MSRPRLRSILATVFIAALLCVSGALAAQAAPTPIPPDEVAWDFGSTNAVVEGQAYNGPGMSTNTWLTYVEDGGVLDIRFIVAGGGSALPANLAAVTLEVVSPSGAVVLSGTYPRDDLVLSREIVERAIGAGEEGIYEVRLDTVSTGGATNSVRVDLTRWDIVPRNDDGTAHTGRVWAEIHRLDNPAVRVWDQTFWYVSDSGVMYRMIERSTNGFSATIQANTAGIMDAATCEPIYQSANSADLAANGWTADPADCDNVFPYEIFFEPPDPTLPERAQRVTGEDWVLPHYTEPAIDLAYSQTAAVMNYGGTFTATLEGQPGTVQVQIDTDGNGVFTDAVDVVLDRTVGVGVHEFDWDGLDGVGDPVPLTRQIFARAELAVAGEIHFLAQDVEVRVGGIEVEALNGPSAGTFTLSWDDSQMGDGCMSGGVLQPCTSAVPPELVGDAVDSQGGVHGWGATNATSGPVWGNDRYIDNWTFTAGVPSPILALEGEVGLTKSVPTVLVEPGTTTTHTWTVTNTGSVALIDQTVIDDVSEVLTVGSIDAASITTTAGTVALDGPGAAVELVVTLDPGESATVSYDVAVAEDAVPWSFFTDTVDAVGWGVEADATQQVMLATIDLEKTADTSQLGTPPQVGDVVTYTFTVTNDTEVDLHGVEVTDALPGLSTIDMDWPGDPGDLAVGEFAVGTATLSLTAAHLDAGVVTNTATATGLTPIDSSVSDDDTATVPLAQEPALELTKSADDSGLSAPPTAGDEITYSFTVENTGNVTLTEVEVVDALPGVSAVELDWPGADGVLGVGETATGTATLTVTTAHIDAGSVTNTATAQANAPGGPVSSEPQSTTVALLQTATLELAKSGDTSGLTAKPHAGEEVVYSFTVTNTGNVTITDVVIVDPMPGLSAIEVEWPQAAGTLAPGDSATGTAILPLTQGHLNDGVISNTAHADGLSPRDGAVRSDDAVAAVFLPQAAILRLTKSADLSSLGEPVRVGDVLVYEFTVVNAGNVTLNEVSIVDDLAGLGPIEMSWPGFPGTLMPGQRATGSAELAVTLGMILSGEVVNVATATATIPDGIVEAEPARATVPLAITRALSLTKTADTTGLSSPAQVGEAISYSFVATNRGSLTLTDVVIDDALPGIGDLAYVWPGDPGVLMPGQSVTATADLVLTEAHLDSDLLENRATASGVGPDGTEVGSAVAAVVVTLRPPALPPTGAGGAVAETVVAIGLLLVAAGGAILRRRCADPAASV